MTFGLSAKLIFHRGERSREVCVKQQILTPSYPSPNVGEGTKLSSLTPPILRGEDQQGGTCCMNRLRGTFCQTTSEISPLHSVSVEMTGLYVIPSGTKWNRGISCQTANTYPILRLPLT